MEEKKLDLNSIIGFILIFILVGWMLYNSAQEQQKATQNSEIKKDEKKEAVSLENTKATEKTAILKTDSLDVAKWGPFAYTQSKASNYNEETVIENDLVKFVFSNKGGYIKEATLKNFERFNKNSGKLVQLISNNNAQLNLTCKTKDNRIINTKDLFFEPQLIKNNQGTKLILRAKTNETSFIEYQYFIKNKEYLLDFNIKTIGLQTVLDNQNPIILDWQLKAFSNEKSIAYENRYAEVVYEYEDGKDNYLGQGRDEKEEVENVTYVAFKQHFFTSILATKTPFKKATLVSKNLVEDEATDTLFTKQFEATIPLEYKNGEIDYAMNWYYGPADYKILNDYDRNFDEIIPLGWGIFGWINKWIFIPTFSLLKDLFPYGLAIILLTILVRIVMSPITYKSYLSQAKMKVLRPEIAEINEKFPKDPMKRQQETMKLYGKAGVNPMAGCIPALMQIPVFYALFSFFPSAIDLRQKGFLWADDLSSFDSIMSLPFYIPFYGNHVSLFPILASIAIFFYMKMTTGDQAMTAAPPQEGMPDMAKIMKIMIYISPIMMLIFFNNYASGLSLYYFISNTITIGIMLVIKNYIIDQDKIHAQIQENKLKPKKESTFQRKMREMMEQAEQQKKATKKK